MSKEVKSIFGLTQPLKVGSDAKRQTLRDQSNMVTLFSGIAILFIGIGDMLDRAFKFSDSVAVPSAALLFIVLFGLLAWRARLNRFNLDSADEFESLELLKAKAAAYRTLMPSLIVVMYFASRHSQVTWVGGILMSIGLALVVESIKSKSKNA